MGKKIKLLIIKKETTLKKHTTKSVEIQCT